MHTSSRLSCVVSQFWKQAWVCNFKAGVPHASGNASSIELCNMRAEDIHIAD